MSINGGQPTFAVPDMNDGYAVLPASSFNPLQPSWDKSNWVKGSWHQNASCATSSPWHIKPAHESKQLGILAYEGQRRFFALRVFHWLQDG